MTDALKKWSCPNFDKMFEDAGIQLNQTVYVQVETDEIEVDIIITPCQMPDEEYGMILHWLITARFSLNGHKYICQEYIHHDSFNLKSGFTKEGMEEGIINDIKKAVIKRWVHENKLCYRYSHVCNLCKEGIQ